MKSVALVLMISACASTTSVLDRDVGPRTGVQLSLVPARDAVQVIPDAIEPRLPRVDRMATKVRYELGDTITAELALCVNPAGTVTEVALTTSTGLSDLDAAILADAGAWQFAELPGDASLRTCQRTTLAYRVR